MIPVPVWEAVLCTSPSKLTELPPFLIHCPHLCLTDPLIAISVLLAHILIFCFLFFLVSVESVRGIDASRTHGAQSNQFMFQHVVVRIWLECTARGRCRHGICRIILVFAPTGARATTTNNHSGKTGKEKLIFFQYATPCCVFISSDYHLTMMMYRIGVGCAHILLRQKLREYSHFHTSDSSSTCRRYIKQKSATVTCDRHHKRPNTEDQSRVYILTTN